jgi:16S rRNA G527 N7-methylase RsmG
VTRVEALGDDSALQGRYAVIVSRGVGGMRRWIPAALRLLQAEGRILLEKGPEALREVRALAPTLAIRGGQIAEMIPLPESSATQRMLVVLTKAG